MEFIEHEETCLHHIVIPEQDAVAKRTEELGAGIRLRSISESDILCAVKAVIEEPRFKAEAAKVSESFHKCGGAMEARKFLETVAGR